jgi:lysylphosphatidylglycerol synthase-like protein
MESAEMLTATAPVEECAPEWFKWVTRISIVFGIAGVAVTTYIVGVGTIFDHLRAIGPWFLALVGAEMITTCCDATAVYLMSRGTGAPSYRDVIVAQFACRAVNSVTPASNLGEALKVSLLSRGCSTGRIIAAVLYCELSAIVMSLIVIAFGTVATAFMFDVAPVAKVALCAAALVSACVAATVVVLLRRGMLGTLTAFLARVHIISRARQQRWQGRLTDLDRRLRGEVGGEHRHGALVAIAISQILQKAITYGTVMAAGYLLGPGQFLALLSAGVVLGWVSTIIPMGLGISEGGNVALFALIGAPTALGVALALARRVNQVVFALLGFTVLTADRVASRVHRQLRTSHTHA